MLGLGFSESRGEDQGAGRGWLADGIMGIGV